jgi:hypothetical protein
MKRTLVIGLALTALFRVNEARAQDTTAVDTSYVEYSESPISLPLGVGLRIPTYDRVNGVTIPWGPKIETSNGRIDVDALVSYRSHLGAWDPSLTGVLRPGDANELRFFVGRGTFSNEEWIRSDLMNSLAVLFAGSDARNFYRSDKASARFARAIMSGGSVFTPYAGLDYERDWSTSDLVPTKSPWSFYGRTGRLRMRRGNPPIDRGHIFSFLVGTGLELASGDIDSKIDAKLERSIATQYDGTCVATPGGLFCTSPRDAFTQATLDGTLKFPTFGSQTLSVRGHGVWTPAAAVAPAQRFSYLGGSGTIATVDQLALGGDHLLFVNADYVIPFEKIQIPIVGNPFLALSYTAGSAGVGSLPSMIQNLGVGVGASILRVDFFVDPATNRSPFSHKTAVTFGADLSF